MDTVKALFAWLQIEGRVIFDAPFVFGIAAIAIVWGTFRFATWWYGRDIKTHETTIGGLKTSHEAAIKLLEKQIEILKDENAALRRDLEKGKQISGPSVYAPLMYGNAAVQSAAVEIKDGSVTFYGAPEQWTDSQISRFAAFTRLQDAGIARITVTNPSTSTVSPTVSTATLNQILDWPKKSS